jgi:hypothetical protein
MGEYLDIVRSKNPSGICDRSDKSDRSPFGRFGRTFSALDQRCPDCIAPADWHRVIEDGRRFLSRWSERADALSWTSQELFGLHTPPERLAPSYRRLSRYDCTGLVWMLDGRPVVTLTAETAAIQTRSGGVLTYRKHNKPSPASGMEQKE